jgi:hypothetical protein
MSTDYDETVKASTTQLVEFMQTLRRAAMPDVAFYNHAFGYAVALVLDIPGQSSAPISTRMKLAASMLSDAVSSLPPEKEPEEESPYIRRDEG